MRSSQKLVAATVTALLGGGTGALADSTTASCDIYAAGEDHASSMTRCTFPSGRVISLSAMRTVPLMSCRPLAMLRPVPTATRRAVLFSGKVAWATKG